MVEIGDAMVQIADKLGIVGSDMLRIITEAQIKIAMINLVLVVTFILGLVIGIYLICRFSYKHYVSEIEKCDCNDDRWTTESDRDNLCVFSSAIYFVLLIFLFVNLQGCATMILCPEYAALEKAVNMFSQLI